MKNEKKSKIKIANIDNFDVIRKRIWAKYKQQNSFFK